MKLYGFLRTENLSGAVAKSSRISLVSPGRNPSYRRSLSFAGVTDLGRPALVTGRAIWARIEVIHSLLLS